MKIQVKVKPNAKHAKVEKSPDGIYLVAVNAPAVEGKANKAVIEAIAKHFGVRKSAVSILVGQKGKLKTLSIDND